MAPLSLMLCSWGRITVCLCAIALVRCGVTSERTTKTESRLATATSPYLREHADNPVQWYEWGSEALERARNEDKPLLISIGYAACHWCHVMEEESFMDTAVARVMNERFIPIKIDREQRPDIDQIYLEAAQLISGSAGWPLNAFALPDGKPFYAGTYFPKDQWLTLLDQIADAYETEKDVIKRQAENVTQGISSEDVVQLSSDTTASFSIQAYTNIFTAWETSLDFSLGGQSGAPKFPMPVIWEFVLQYHFVTGNERALEIITTTLDRMAGGGIYDQLGGGFARYTTDEEWKEPHFEKMLYDNAQLVSLYSHAYQVTRNPAYKKVVDETLAFVKKEMTDENGGFFSSLNADSEGEEGRYYTWLRQDLDTILDGDDLALVSEYYNVSESGNFEGGRNILRLHLSDEAFAREHGLSDGQWTERLARARRKMLAAREKRIRPTTDDKIITSWNALMLQGYVDAYVATSEKDYLESALRNARFITSELSANDDGLRRTYRGGKVSVSGFLDDYAFTSRAFIRLYEVTFDLHWLEKARQLADYALAHFADPATPMFFYISDLSEAIVLRKKDVVDNVIPSSNSAMAEVLLLLGEYYQYKPYTDRGTSMVRKMSGDRVGLPEVFYANWARLTAFEVFPRYHVAVVGKDAASRSVALQQVYNPLALYLGGDEENLPLLENKLVKNKTLIYVCRDHICKFPVEDIEDALGQMSIDRQLLLNN